MDRSLIDRLGPERCRVAYFFMVGGEGEYDRTYKIQDPLARRALAAVKENGADIGLHASYAAGQEPRLIARERALLEKTAGIPITKNRHHILGWRETSDGHEIAAGGIGWDSTMGYADVPGFRLGVCRPVPLFDPIAQKPLGIEEHPMTIMECTLSKYMNLDEEQAFACVRRLADATIRYRGEFVVNWHNSWLSEREPGYHRRLYQRMLDYLVSQEGVLSAQAEARRQCS